MIERYINGVRAVFFNFDKNSTYINDICMHLSGKIFANDGSHNGTKIIDGTIIAMQVASLISNRIVAASINGVGDGSILSFTMVGSE
jgi:hypothetical protein